MRCTVFCFFTHYSRARSPYNSRESLTNPRKRTKRRGSFRRALASRATLRSNAASSPHTLLFAPAPPTYLLSTLRTMFLTIPVHFGRRETPVAPSGAVQVHHPQHTHASRLECVPLAHGRRNKGDSNVGRTVFCRPLVF